MMCRSHFRVRAFLSNDIAQIIKGAPFIHNFINIRLILPIVFLIKTNPEDKTIEVGFCPQVNKVTIKIIGKTPQEIYLEIAKRKLIEKADHYAYLGKELQKAFIALNKNIDYVQDEELNL